MLYRLLLVLLCASPALAQHPGPKHAHHHGHKGTPADGGDQATMNHRFTDVGWAVKMFDNPARAAWQKPAALIDALKIAPGAVVADLGAGTGYFLPHLVNATGPTGTVVALEVEPNLLGHIRERAEKAGWSTVIPVLSSFDRPRVARASLDLALMVDVYHHINNRKVWMGQALAALRPGGRFVVVDFKPGKLPVGPPEGHKLPAAQIKTEMVAAGFEFVEALDLLPHQNTLVFRRPAK